LIARLRFFVVYWEIPAVFASHGICCPGRIVLGNIAWGEDRNEKNEKSERNEGIQKNKSLSSPTKLRENEKSQRSKLS
jgi:hypothetical protein